MWKSTIGHTIANSNDLAKKMLAENNNDPDEWDTDPDFVVSIALFGFKFNFSFELWLCINYL
jgi:hypothetical protein